MWHCERLVSIDSTQHEAIRRIDRWVVENSGQSFGGSGQESLPAFLLWTTEQTKGVGRHGREWLTSGKGLAASFAWPEAARFKAIEAWPIRVALATILALQRLPSIDTGTLGLKWPNDIMVGDAKLGGVLVSRAVFKGQAWLIAGIGLNLEWTRPTSLTRAVTDLENICQEIPSAEQVMGVLQEAMTDMLAVPDAPLAQRFAQRDVYADLPVTIVDLQGTIVCQGSNRGINEQGELLLEEQLSGSESRIRPVRMGEVSLRAVMEER